MIILQKIFAIVIIALMFVLCSCDSSEDLTALKQQIADLNGTISSLNDNINGLESEIADLKKNQSDSGITPVYHTVTFDTDGGTEIPPQTIKHGESVLCPGTVTKPGYTFNGWDAEYNGEKINLALYFRSDLPSLYTVTGDIKFIVKWQKATYKAYDATIQPGFYDNKIASYSIDTVDTALPLDSSHRGYTVTGWYLDEDLTQPITEIKTGTCADTPVYPKLVPIDYEIRYEALDLGSGQPEVISNTGNPSTYTIESATITFDSLKKPARDGYTFIGWTCLSPVTEGATGNQITQPTQIGGGTVGNVTFRGSWHVISYTISYLNADGTLACTENYSAYNLPKTDLYHYYALPLGESFEGWYSDEDLTQPVTEIPAGTTGNITLYPKIKKKTVSVTYYLNGGQNSDQNLTEFSGSLTLRAPTKEGATFGGWYEKSSCTGNRVIDVSSYKAAETIELYAKWIYTVTYKSSTDGAIISSQTFCTNDLPLNVQPYKAGKTYVGSCYSDQAMSAEKVIGKIAASESIVLYVDDTKFVDGSAGLQYKYYDDKTCAVISYTGNDTAVVVPQYFNGYLVVEIGTSAFQQSHTKANELITSISLPSSIITIGDYAFASSNIKTMVLPEGLIEIGASTFISCAELTDITIPYSTISIGSGAFQYCSKLVNVTFNGAYSIADQAFAQCTSLKVIYIPDTVCQMSDDVFVGTGTVIKCAAISKPTGWSKGWNSSNNTVEWGVNRVLRVGVNPEYEPYEYYQDGTLSGIDIDVIKELCKQSKYEIQFVVVNDFDELFTAMDAGQCDCIISAICQTAPRDQQHLATIAYAQDSDETYVIYTRSNYQMLLNTLNPIIDDMRTDGTITTIQSKYNRIAHTVVSNSMTPTLIRGNTYYFEPVDASTLKVGDIILINTEITGLPARIPRRITAINNNNGELSFVVKGDNNAVVDSTPVTADAIVGILITNS